MGLLIHAYIQAHQLHVELDDSFLVDCGIRATK